MKKRYGKGMALMAGTSLFLSLSNPAYASGSGDLVNLQQVVNNQQQQLDAQATEIAALKKALASLLNQSEQNKAPLAATADKKDIEKVQTETMVVSKNPKVDVSLYGQVNRAGLWADNGDSSKVYFVDNSFSSSRMGIDAVAKATETLNVGGKFEYEIISNSSLEVNQDAQDTSASLKIRHVDAFVESKALGKISLGQGSTATDGTAERDLSGTTVVAYSQVQDQAGGQKLYDSTTGILSSSLVKSYIDNMDGLSRRDRIRYDTPIFAGFQLSGSAIESGAYDTALSYSRKFGGITIAAAAGYANSGDLTKWDDQYDGSASILLENGLNLTFACGIQEYDADDRNDPNYWYTKLGYKVNLFTPGITAFAVDYGMWNDFDQNDNEAQSIGFAFVQDIADWGTELYIAYRLYTLDSEAGDFDDVNSVMGGARIKF
jgi:hypothetical protein